MKKVLVTGGTGYIASWTILKLLKKNYQVTATVRTKDKGEFLKAMLENHDANLTNFEYKIADITRPVAWKAICQGQDAVMHIASPLGGNNQNDPKLIDTAVRGTLNVLRGATHSKVKKIILTSSIAASSPENNCTDQEVDETFWTDLNNKSLNAYRKSKIIAEQTAWNFMKDYPEIPLTTIMPGAVFGPMLDKKQNGSVLIIQKILEGQLPAFNVNFEVVDVRDLADLHILALENDASNNKRINGLNENIMMKRMNEILRYKIGPAGENVKTVVVPDNLLLTIAIGVKPLRTFIPMLNRQFLHTNKFAKETLKWQPRPAEETIIDSAENIIELKLI